MMMFFGPFDGGGGAPDIPERDLTSEFGDIKTLNVGQENQYKRFHKKGKPGSDPLLTAIYGLATDYLTPGGQFNIEMTPEEIRANQQQTLGLFAGQGNVVGNQAIATDVLNRDAYQRAKLLEAVGLGESALTTGTEAYSRLTNPLLAYASDLFGSNQSAAADEAIAGANKSGGVTSGALSSLGAVAGGVGIAL